MREIIRKLRAERGLSQKVLAERTGISESMIARVESGDRVFSLENIEVIVDTLGLSPEVAAELRTARAESRQPRQPGESWRRDIEERVANLERRLDALDEPKRNRSGRVVRMTDAEHLRAAETGRYEGGDNPARGASPDIEQDPEH